MTTSPDEPVEVEVLDSAPAPANDGASAANAAIVAASQAALDMPDLPGRDEFLNLATQARMLSLSGAAPEAVRGDPHIAFHVAMVGRDLGISPSAALNLIDVIQSRKGPQLSLSPQLLNGQIRRLGLGSIMPVLRSDERCVAAALAPGGVYDPRCKPLWPNHHDDCRCAGILGESEFTWDDAKAAGLVKPDCEPGNHSQACRTWTSRKTCNTGYINYPKRMLWWRASGFAADDYFPEASLGLYSPEELGQTVDDEGRMIDPAQVELPEGFGPRGDAPEPDAEPADPDVLADFQARIAALPDEQRKALRDKWVDNPRLTGRKIDELPASLVNLVKAMLEGFESQAARTAAPAPEPDSDGDGDGDEPATVTDTASTGEAIEAAGTEADDEKPKPQQDQGVAEWVRTVAAAAPAHLVDETTAYVKTMHHASVNSDLADRRFDGEGLHIDTRRMALTAALIEETLHPERCVAIGCDTDTATDLYCEAHDLAEDGG